ncbi:MAG: hypothetical protein F4X59_13715 [Holophagales bacterium]|nr:hypothetical protein [Holophagales bacterium]MYC11171.1 hypothetical protein [Holophagales bacterium]
MDTFVLVLAAYAGYWFQTHYHPLRFYAMRASGYHIVSRSAIWGTVLYFPGYALAALVWCWLPDLDWGDYELIEGPADLGAVLALFLGFAAPPLLNRFVSETASATRAAELRGDFVELLLDRAFTQKRDVAVTLNGGKVYIGVPTRSALLAHEDSDFTLALLASGFRSGETSQLIITTDYEQLDQRLKADDSSSSVPEGRPLATADGDAHEHEGADAEPDPEGSVSKQPVTREDLEITIPIAEVASIRMFNIAIYKEMFAPSDETKKNGGTDSPGNSR